MKIVRFILFIKIGLICCVSISCSTLNNNSFVSCDELSNDEINKSYDNELDKYLYEIVPDAGDVILLAVVETPPHSPEVIKYIYLDKDGKYFIANVKYKKQLFSYFVGKEDGDPDRVDYDKVRFEIEKKRALDFVEKYYDILYAKRVDLALIDKNAYFDDYVYRFFGKKRECYIGRVPMDENVKKMIKLVGEL